MLLTKTESPARTESPAKTESLDQVTTRSLAAVYQEVRDLTETLAAPLSAEDQTAQSMADTSPTKWHRAHVTWFFETFLLERFEPGFKPYDPAYRVLFNSYYETVGPQFPRPDRGVITRPGVAEVGAYRSAVDERMTVLLHRIDELDPGEADALTTLVTLGLHHEQQHQELLLMDIKHVLSRNPLGPVYRTQTEPDPSAAAALGWVDVDGGLVDIGHAETETGTGAEFGFDNEFPRHRVHLEPFAIADRLVTAGEWQDFVSDGGYQRPDLWLSDGWRAVQDLAWDGPLYWQQRNDGWFVHTLGGTRPITAAEPVSHVSHYEADAYARWAGARLPTEAEWEHAVTGSQASSVSSRVFSLDHLHPQAADPIAGHTLAQAFGEVWQWTSSAYLPYPGFAAAPGAVGEYNGKFMSGQMVLRGSAAITPPGHARLTYRNFFPPSARWPMTGVRLAKGSSS